MEDRDYQFAQQECAKIKADTTGVRICMADEFGNKTKWLTVTEGKLPVIVNTLCLAAATAKAGE